MRELKHYKLIGTTPVPMYDLIEWAKWFETADRRLRLTRVLGRVDVSTVFLGFDHSYSEEPCAPVLWETMGFRVEDIRQDAPRKESYEVYQRRYTTAKEALWGHYQACYLILVWELFDMSLGRVARGIRTSISRIWVAVRGARPPSCTKDNAKSGPHES